MIGNAVKVVLLALVLLLLAAVLAGYWLIGTSAGTRWLWGRATPLVPGELVAETIEGSIASGLDLGAVSYASEGLDIDIRKARVAAKFVLFPLTITVR
ncbi:MAG TPA: hypothetical protein VNQ14_07440, partial [Woeseiaceae bacterium]|nr:hypothetical protein [Woeseiaceae bacterium]